MKKVMCIIGLIITMISFASCGTNADISNNTSTLIQDVSSGQDTTTDAKADEYSTGTLDNTQGTTESTASGDTTDNAGLSTTENPTSGTISNSQPSNNTATTNIDEFLSKYSGRWYLEGYSDVYVDIFLDANEKNILSIQANNFSLPGAGDKEDGIIYPQKQNLSTYSVGLGVHLSGIFNMKSYSFKEGYVCIGSYKFVRTQGGIAQVAGVSLNKTTLELYVGESETLIATVFPDGAVNKKVTWSSTDDSAVTVSSDGKVTGIVATSPHNVGITATTEYGHYMATCNVIVKEKTAAPTPSPQPIRVSGVQISKTALNLNIGDTQQLTATVSPSNADNKNVTWASSNTSVAQISSSGQVTAKGAGSATITVTTVDGNYIAKCTVNVTESPFEQRSDVLIIRGTHSISNQTIDTDIYITSTGKATFSNVTVNGNVYCYGQLIVSGGSANNVYAYYWDLGGISSSCDAYDGSHGLIKGAFRKQSSVTIKDYSLDYAFDKWGKK